MSVPSLAGLCRKTIFANIDELSYVSTLPYEKCREILKHVKTAQQLAVIEEYSPQIAGEDSELWEAFIKKDFPVPMKRKNYRPENPRSWRMVYERYAKEEREAEAHALAKLGATFADLNKLKQENRTNIADARLLPRIGRIGSMARSRVRGFGSGSATLTFGGGARTKNAVQKAKKEAMEVAARKKLSTPALKPRTNLVRVQKAPESMRNEYRIKRQPAFLPPSAKTGSKRPREEDDERVQKEARLLAAKKPKTQPTVLRDDEFEDSSAVAPAAVEASKTGAYPNVKKPMGLFSRAHNPSRQQNKVIVETVGSKSSRQQVSRTNTVTPKALDSSPNSLVSSPGCEEFRSNKIKPRRSSRSASVASSLFGSPEPGSPPAPKGRRPSLQSSDGKSPSPLTAAPTPPPPAQRSGAPTAAKPQPGEVTAGTPSKPKLEDPTMAGTSSAAAAPGAGGGTAAQPPRKKQKKVDIFMRPKKAAH